MRGRKRYKKRKQKSTQVIKPVKIRRREKRFAEMARDAEFRERYHDLRMWCMTE